MVRWHRKIGRGLVIPELELRAGGLSDLPGASIGDEQRHDRSAVGTDPQGQHCQQLAAAAAGLQRRQAAGAGTHVQGRPEGRRNGTGSGGGKRTRPDPFKPDVERIVQWLQAEPQCNAKTLLGRLIELNPQRYGEHHLRTLQRRLRGYRLQWSGSSGRWPLRQQPQAQGCTGTEPRRRQC